MKMVLVQFTPETDEQCEEMCRDTAVELFDNIIKPVVPTAQFVGWRVAGSDTIDILIETVRIGKSDADTMRHRLLEMGDAIVDGADRWALVVEHFNG